MSVGELAALATAVLWTLSTLAWTSAGKYVGALAVSFLRLAITCVFLAVYGRVFRGLWLPSDASADTWLILGLSGFAGFFLGDLCFFKALLLIGPRLSLLMQSLTPPMVAIASWLVLGKGLAPRQWLAMAVTLAGVAWVVLERPNDHASEHAPRRRRQGLWLAILAAAGQGIGYILSQEGMGDYDAVAATFIRVFGAMAGYGVLITLLRRWPAMAAAAGHGRAMAIMTFGAVVGPFAGVALSMVALRHCHAGVAATIFAIVPVLVLPFLIFLYREKVSLRAAGGAILSVIGVALLVLWEPFPRE
jgi:drug/metabolite transporter (DMT)-like permease